MYEYSTRVFSLLCVCCVHTKIRCTQDTHCVHNVLDVYTEIHEYTRLFHCVHTRQYVYTWKISRVQSHVGET